MKKKFAIAGYICFAIYTISLLQTSATRYYNSIYNALPVWVWVVFSLGLAIGTLILYLGVKNHTRRLQIHGISIVGCLIGVFWFYAELLGLRFWSAPGEDLLLHFGQGIAIAETGTISSENIYPLLHTTLAQLHFITGLPVDRFGPVLSLLYYPLLLAGIVLLVRRYSSKRIALFVGVAAVPIFYWKYAHHLMPWVAYFALIPLLVLMLSIHRSEVRSSQRSYIGMGILLLSFGIGIGHPMSGLVAMLVVATIIVTQRLAGRWGFEEEYQQPMEVLILSPLIVAYPMWYLIKSTFQGFLFRTVASFYSETTEAGSQAERAAESGYTIWQIIQRWIIEQWGPGLVILAIGAAVAVVILRRVILREATVGEIIILSVYSIGIMVAVSTLTFDLVVNTEVYRPNQITIAAAIVLFGFALWWTTDHSEGRRGVVLRSVMVLILVLCVVWAPFTIYYEPQHISEQEFVGSEHHLEYRVEETTTYSDSMPRRISLYLEGLHEVSSWENRAFGGTNSELPKFLGYDKNRTVSESLEREEYYLITKERDTEWYKQEPTNRYPYLTYYTEENVDRLHDDPTANKIYTNSGYSIWQG
ncbi:hypothetical protein [Haloterrigena salinisoli]|uniref:hypothetical protein n=1 Tax=Haloterrigena salinisoli TaxID=3132747 RepID=UPI0030D2473B